MMEYQIIPLPKEEWKGTPIMMRYTTEEYYDLETQSCNVRAIAFYRSQGFELIGFDSCCYTNLDVERHEIRFDFGYFLHKRAGRQAERTGRLT